MSSRDGSWLVKLEGYPETSTDDLTLNEIETAERVSGVPYTLMDPHESIRVAKALFALLMARAGMDEDLAVKTAGQLTVAKLHRAFSYVPPTRPQPAIGGRAGDPPAPAPTSVAG